MNTRNRIIILSVLLGVVVAIFAFPYVKAKFITEPVKQFTVTAHPMTKFTEATEQKKVIYLEFYGKT